MRGRERLRDTDAALSELAATATAVAAAVQQVCVILLSLAFQLAACPVAGLATTQEYARASNSMANSVHHLLFINGIRQAALYSLSSDKPAPLRERLCQQPMLVESASTGPV